MRIMKGDPLSSGAWVFLLRMFGCYQGLSRLYFSKKEKPEELLAYGIFAEEARLRN